VDDISKKLLTIRSQDPQASRLRCARGPGGVQRPWRVVDGGGRRKRRIDVDMTAFIKFTA
jgi:hypothetical protein